MKLLPVDMSPYGDTYYPMLEPLVLIDTNGIYPALREGMIQHLEGSKKTASGVYTNSKKENINTYYRSSSHCSVSDSVYERIKNRLDYVVDWQISQQKDTRDYVLCERLQFLRYNASNNDKFLKHTDNAYYDNDGKFLYTSPQRVISTVSYFNDDFTGGEIVFDNIRDANNQPFVYKPVAGTTIIFPSDLRFPHEVRPVTSGIRYCVVGWYGLA